MRAMTILAVVTVAAAGWQSTALGQDPYTCTPPTLQRVQRLPASGSPVTTITPLPTVGTVQGATSGPKTLVGPPVTTYRHVAPRVPVATGRYYAYRPMVSVSPKLTNYHIGRGIIGQPKVYVPGQPVRNFIRYLSP